MDKPKRIIVLGGGDSPEREVSLRSSKAVYDACQKLGYKTEFVDPAQIKLSSLQLNPEEDLVLPILHGKGGEDGTVQSQLEQLGISYLGSDSKASEDCFNKLKTRQILQSAGLPVADGESVDQDTYLGSKLAHAPHVLKDPEGGSSIGTIIVREPGTKKAEITELFSTTKSLLIEELIEGVELTVPVLGDQALPVIEIKPPKDGEFDYENKYNGQTAEICPPSSIDERQQQQVQALGLKAHQAAKCRHLSRVDIMFHSSRGLFILEINTIPGLTDQSLFPKSAAAAGLDFKTLVERFIGITLDKKVTKI